MLGQLVAAQFDLERAIGELIRAGSGTAIAQSQLHAIAALQRQVGAAAAGEIASLRGNVTAMVAETQAIAQLGRDAINGTDRDPAETFGQRMQRLHTSIDALHDDLFEKKLLDAYLRFDSARDEEEYRKREQERDAEIKRLSAIGTPEALAKAYSLTKDQLTDAKAHGAGESPEFAGLERQMLQINEQLAAPEPKVAERSSQPDDIGAALAAAGVTTGAGPAPQVAQVRDPKLTADQRLGVS